MEMTPTQTVSVGICFSCHHLNSILLYILSEKLISLVLHLRWLARSSSYSSCCRFRLAAKNGDGFITVEELRSVLSSLGLKQGRTVEECRKMISKVDVDGDGKVNFKEFKQMMKGGGFAALS
ncbi:hypothetical protein C4D60_Mb02t07700 [Musa balbisiana]|uniref:EF-hand domain-containing protein n=1 Tax=Musa balbisiana TaxID=52838 RepID=A0A4S8I909_MUSBA|nr:hypothetical protein C4D60_Mb02t07700 [Musa balbisiana]